MNSLTPAVALRLIQHCQMLSIEDNPYNKDGRKLRDTANQSKSLSELIEQLFKEPDSCFSVLSFGQMTTLLQKLLRDLPSVIKECELKNENFDAFSYLRVSLTNKGKGKEERAIQAAEINNFNLTTYDMLKTISKRRMEYLASKNKDATNKLKTTSERKLQGADLTDKAIGLGKKRIKVA
jgi:hypothetical protein